MRIRSAAAAGLIVGLAAVSAAAAEPVRLQWSTYLRSGPGQGFAAIDEVEHDARLDLRGCAGAWCRVAAAGAVGFVHRDALALPRPPSLARGAPGVRCVTADQPGGRGPEPTRFCSRRP